MKMRIARLTKREDKRGWLIENENPVLAQTMRHFFLSFSLPGVVRGQHYHENKREWFLVLKGKAKIVFKDIKSGDLIEKLVSGEKPEIIEVPPKVAHAIQNIGKKEMYLIAFVSETLDRRHPDTFAYRVI